MEEIEESKKSGEVGKSDRRLARKWKAQKIEGRENVDQVIRHEVLGIGC